MQTTMTRTLGRSGLIVSALGLGTWGIGGEWTYNGLHDGWGEVDDAESTRAVYKALEMGVNFFDTADVYGCGRSERVLGQALTGHRHEVVIATKFANRFDEETKTAGGRDVTPVYIKRAVDASLIRLQTDYIDLYQLHGLESEESADEIVATLEDLVSVGKIRFYGLSDDNIEHAQTFAQGQHCTAIQHHLNIFGGNDEILSLCEEQNLASICRTPLAMGLLTGKYQSPEQLATNDVRLHAPWWDYFKEGKMQEWLQKIEQVRAILTTDGRTLAQGSLAWILARSSRSIPIPGFKSAVQVEDNAGTLLLGPLSEPQMREISQLLS
ncbi:aldo/keto reductase [Ktedonospora formicarum]|uniref:Aldo/keto reductase n=1 Tax=Ktedonospora formicarum TaxID=2778364 RepID=A0A8J3I4Z5_9CHLR|nr:aldo/keto reductase [Ktedonospora formicarum]GHO46252.1 aldo/keto reductase [Ktedonospora formicarum]